MTKTSNRINAGQLIMKNNILTGLTSGFVSAIMFISAAQGHVLGVLFFTFLAPLPIIITGLGWGWISSAISAMTAASTIAILVNPLAATHHILGVGLPMAICSYMLMLSREYPTDNHNDVLTEWYPPGRVLSLLTLIAGLLAAVSLLSFAGTERELQTIILERIDTFGLELPNEIDPNNFAVFVSKSFTPALAIFWMTVACLNLWLGGLITDVSGRLRRPWPDLTNMTIPRETPLIMIVSIGGSLLGGYPGLIALGFTGAIFFAYFIIGLAIIHNVTRQLSARIVILIIVYTALFLLHPYSSFVVSLLGITEPLLPIRRRFKKI
ncbi:MAG: hypothetical protein HRT83_05550 [Hyphomicrobiaceae bacterium]|nr:hypothetical protein [Hyphomicrobiaceae bacterium]